MTNPVTSDAYEQAVLSKQPTNRLVSPLEGDPLLTCPDDKITDNPKVKPLDDAILEEMDKL